ncbi:hypothetical protein HL653_15170 [Sphingomonas sp. AP4-R1]|uniref:hypothetical protein n=1 Tax=Sphingomonas sp. AP4-R1 TaxID=2735134 RepID=UPI001493D266|nr:hypothetical protein [Sphingomonas sp. AP4-R1]QJU58932.1 hypothetical protein HL653_15170 [Sphingomonas sp. AP4-R1]
MSYIDFRMKPAAPKDGRADSPAPATSPSHRESAPKRASDRSAVLMTGGLIVTIVALVFALALASIREPFTAAIVTIILLLPTASLLGGDKHRR